MDNEPKVFHFWPKRGNKNDKRTDVAQDVTGRTRQGGGDWGEHQKGVDGRVSKKEKVRKVPPIVSWRNGHLEE